MARPDPRGRAMLRTYRSAKAGPVEHRDALWSRIEASLDQGAPGPSLELEPSVEPGPVRGSGWVVPAVAATVAVAALVVAALTLGSGGSRDASRRRAAAEATYETSHDQAPAEPVVVPTEALTGAAAAEPPSTPTTTLTVGSEPPSPSARRRPARPGGRDPLAPASDAVLAPTPALGEDATVTVDDELQAEMALIRAARHALQAARPARALEVLDAHARAFPAGQMREDRAVLRIEALCGAGKAPQARAEVALFLRAFPGSAHAQRVRASCAAP